MPPPMSGGGMRSTKKSYKKRRNGRRTRKKRIKKVSYGNKKIYFSKGGKPTVDLDTSLPVEGAPPLAPAKVEPELRGAEEVVPADSPGTQEATRVAGAKAEQQQQAAKPAAAKRQSRTRSHQPGVTKKRKALFSGTPPGGSVFQTEAHAAAAAAGAPAPRFQKVQLQAVPQQEHPLQSRGGSRVTRSHMLNKKAKQTRGTSIKK